ncbi:MAG: hypothetical protein WA632_14775 [Gallionella sp.]
MDKEFLMGNNDWLMRSKADSELPTSISPRLRKQLVMTAMKNAYEFYSAFFDFPITHHDFDKLALDYEHAQAHAKSLGLFAPGGIRENDHLNLWCLSNVLSPEVYVESGVFIGSSLHALMSSPRIKQIYAIDPSLSNLKIPRESIPGKTEYIEDRDFSQIAFDVSGMSTLVYFDDHIDTAKRIIQASEKGFSYLLFDDSTGMEGICQRLYPAIPTIPMILNAEILSAGEELSWTFNRSIRVKLTITEDLITSCFRAKALIRKCEPLPNLGLFLPQTNPQPVVDTGKFLVELAKAGH